MNLDKVTQHALGTGNLLRQITEFSPYAIMRLERDLRIAEVNEAFCELLCTPLEQIINKNLWQIFPDWPRKPILKSLEKCSPYQINALQIDRQVSGNWQRNYWDMAIWPTFSPEKIYTGAVLLAANVTKHVKDTLQREDMLATLAHDLKVPLSGADRLLELLLEDMTTNQNAPQPELLAKLKQSNQDALHLIHNVLCLYSMGQNSQTYRFTEVDLVPLTAQVLSELSIMADGKNVVLQLSAPSPVAHFPADLVSVRRLVINLVHNAIKFSFADSIIDISIGTDERSVVFCVTDKGPGMTKDIQQNLFQRFGQSQQTQPELTGSGLGLYVCQNIVQVHHGKISCVSTPGVGTTFTVRLPLDPRDRL